MKYPSVDFAEFSKTLKERRKIPNDKKQINSTVQ